MRFGDAIFEFKRGLNCSLKPEFKFVEFYGLI